MKLTDEQYRLFVKNFHISSLKEFSEIFKVPFYVMQQAKSRMIQEERSRIYTADSSIEKEK